MPDKQSFPFFAAEGRLHIYLSLALAVILQIYAGTLVALPFWVLAVFVLQFFRDPPRMIPQGAGQIVCPAHGKVVFTGLVDDPYLNRKALKISIFMNVFSVHSNFTPYAGVIQKIWYHSGKFFNAALDKASEENERNAIWIKTADSQDIVFVQIAGLVARRILCHVSEGEQVGRGQRYGFIRFGSKVDVYLPETARATVCIGDSVMSGNDIIAQLNAMK